MFDNIIETSGNLEADESLREGLAEAEAATLEPEIIDIHGVGEVLVSGSPFDVDDRLDDHQGDNVFGAKGDCGLVSVANILTLAGIDCEENDVVGRAIDMGLCNYSVFMNPEERGGSNVLDRSSLLSSYGIPNSVHYDKKGDASLESIAEYTEDGRGVSISLNAGYAWNDVNSIGDGSSNHCVIVTGTARDVNTGELKGLFICDSGLTDRESGSVFLSVDVLDDAYLNAVGSSAIVTDSPIR